MLRVKHMLSKLALVLVLAFALNAAAPLASDAQCPMCRTNVEKARKAKEDGEIGAKTVGSGLNSGILYLLATPYLFGMAIGGYWYYNRRKRQKEGFES